MSYLHDQGIVGTADRFNQLPHRSRVTRGPRFRFSLKLLFALTAGVALLAAFLPRRPEFVASCRATIAAVPPFWLGDPSVPLEESLVIRINWPNDKFERYQDYPPYGSLDAFNTNDRGSSKVYSAQTRVPITTEMRNRYKILYRQYRNVSRAGNEQIDFPVPEEITNSFMELQAP